MPPKPVVTAVEAEAKSTLDMFQNAADGRVTMDNVFKEIEKDRQAFGIGSAKEKAYVESVHWKLVKSNILPEVSLRYASENFDNLGEGGAITENSFKRFRVATYKDMDPIEKSMNHFLMKSYDSLKNQTSPGYGVCVSQEDINMALDQARAKRTGVPSGDADNGEQNDAPTEQENARAGEIMSALTANGALLTKKVFDRSEGGITEDSINHSLGYDFHFPQHLNGPERIALTKVLDDFDAIAGGDGLISPMDLKYYAGKHGLSSAGISRTPPMKSSEYRVRPFDQ